MPLISAQKLSKSFRMGDATVQVLKDCDFDLMAGEFVAIEGRSGSGKSTLLHLLGCLDHADQGRILYSKAGAELPLTFMSESERAGLRNMDFGFVFQFYHLLPELSVVENTVLASMVKYSVREWMSFKSPARKRAEEILADLGLSHRLTHRPNQLSGGERQRVAIARALMNSPRVLYADEPTGNLDYETGLQIMGVLEKLHREQKQSIVMVTHDRALAKQADRTLVLKAGKLEAC